MKHCYFFLIASTSMEMATSSPIITPPASSNTSNSNGSAISNFDTLILSNSTFYQNEIGGFG